MHSLCTVTVIYAHEFILSIEPNTKCNLGKHDKSLVCCIIKSWHENAHHFIGFAYSQICNILESIYLFYRLPQLLASSESPIPAGNRIIGTPTAAAAAAAADYDYGIFLNVDIASGPRLFYNAVAK